MPHDFARNAPPSSQEDALLDDLELRCPNDVAAARGLASSRRKVAVTVRPANVGERELFAIAGHTTELRRQGAVCLAPRPAMVGDVFHLTFDRAELDVTPVLGVCDRCALLSDASFELRFKFVQEILLPPSPAGGRNE